MVWNLLLWVLLLVAMGAVWLVTGSVIAVCILCCVLALPILSWALNFLVVQRLSLELVLPNSCVKDTAVEGHIKVNNPTLLPLSRVICVLTAENGLTGERENLQVPVCVPPHSKGEESFSLTSRYCGYVNVRCERFLVTDLFGLFPLPRHCDMEKGMTVLPLTFMQELLLSVTADAPEESDSYAPDQRGNDRTETFQLRDYVPGDELRQIHWKLSGKLDRLIVRDASLPLSRSLLIFWDKWPGKTPTSAEYDALAEVTATLCQSVCKLGIPYLLGWSEPDERSCVTEDVLNDDALLSVLPRMIKKGGIDETSGIERLLHGDTPHFTRLIYLANAVPESLHELEGQAEVLLCGSAEENGGKLKTFCFSPDNYTEAMAFLKLDL